MPMRREFPARTIEAEDVRLRRVDPHYTKSLIRLLAAHALAEKLTALGYQPVANTPEEFSRLIATEFEVWADVIRAAKIDKQ